MNKPVIISISGGSGSGKTTVAKKIMNRFKGRNIVLINLDDYYKRHDDLTLEEREKINNALIPLNNLFFIPILFKHFYFINNTPKYFVSIISLVFNIITSKRIYSYE